MNEGILGNSAWLTCWLNWRRARAVPFPVGFLKSGLSIFSAFSDMLLSFFVNHFLSNQTERKWFYRFLLQLGKSSVWLSVGMFLRQQQALLRTLFHIEHSQWTSYFLAEIRLENSHFLVQLATFQKHPFTPWAQNKSTV